MSSGHSNPREIWQGSHRMEVAWDQEADRAPSGVQYARHRPEETLLYRVIDDHYPDFLAQIEMEGRTLPRFVRREFEEYLKCGRLEHGFLRVRCTDCHAEKLLAFSCKRHGCCPSCSARRIVESAALLVDEVLPAVPMRQWVLSVPFALRFLSASNSAAMGETLRIVYRTISGSVIRKAGLTRSTGQISELKGLAGVQPRSESRYNKGRALRFIFAGGVMDIRSSVTNHSFWICAAVAVLTSLANSVSADSIDTITVEAQRDKAKLEREVNAFVSSTIVQPHNYDESLWRWKDNVCPLVAGLNKEQGEFVLARLSEIAKTAGAPLGSETCKPNLYVILTPDPELLLKQWWRRDVDLFDGEAGPNVRRFLETPRPIRVWYSAGTVGADGQFFIGLLDATSERAKPTGDASVVRIPPEAATRLKLTATRNISSVIVVVDSTKIGNINFGQLTDYIGLVGLAQINFEKQSGDVPTILRLFESSGESRPKEMTAWDRALLHALYSTSQTNVMQIAQMQSAALKDIAPKSPN